MVPRRVAPAGLIGVGFETLVSSLSTAVGLNATNKAGRAFHISIETQNARYRGDGTDPALSTGVVLIKDNAYWFEDIDGNKLKFIRETGTCKISVMAYKRAGD